MPIFLTISISAPTFSFKIRFFPDMLINIFEFYLENAVVSANRQKSAMLSVDYRKMIFPAGVTDRNVNKNVLKKVFLIYRIIDIRYT